MFVRPSLVSGLRSSWKPIKQSPYFILQQQNNNNSKRRQFPEYRIITKGFPHYKVAEHDDLNQILESFDDVLPDVLSEVEGKKTMKKILKQLRDRCSRELPFDEDGDGYVTDSSVTPEDGNSSGENDDHDHDHDHDNYSLEVNMIRSGHSSSASIKSENAVVDEKEKNKMTNRDLATRSPDQLDFMANHTDYSDLNSDSSDAEGAVDANNDVGVDPEGVDGGADVYELRSLGNNLIYSLMSWFEGPPIEGVRTIPAKQTATTNNSSNNKNTTILDIPMQFIALLTYPEIDPKATKKASFAVLREISFVKQRRKVLMMFTLYLFIMRMCSLDLFLVLLFASNCAMLFLMKNSGRVNVTMAKRAVRQRIGWAKQWAGSLFRNRVNSANPPNNNNNLTGSNGRKNNTSASMVKSGSTDAMQSGSMSDTTYGGLVTRKMAPKRGVFFRNKGSQAYTTSQTTKESNSERLSGTVSAEPPSLLDSTQQESSKSSSISQIPPLTPTSLGGTMMQVSLSSPPQNVSATGVTEISQASTLTKRRFFPKRAHSNGNHNNGVTTSQQSQLHGSLNNHALSDIVEHRPSSAPQLPNVFSTGINYSTQQNDAVSGILNNGEIIGATNSNKIMNGAINNNSGSVSSVYSAPSSNSNNNIDASTIINGSPTGTSDADFINFDDSGELSLLTDEVRTRKFSYTKNPRTIIGHRKNNSGGVVNIGINTRVIEPPD